MKIKNTSKTSDIAGYFEEDFFDSALIYQIPRLRQIDHTMSYLSREDLVASESYKDINLLGLVILSVGETITIQNDEIKRVYQPLDVIKLFSYNDITNLLPISILENTLTDKSISKQTKFDQDQIKYKYDGNKFRQE